LTGGGMALAGLTLGYIGLVATTIGILAAIIIPNFIAYKPYCSFTRCAMPICSSRLMGVSMEM
jgi:hypothetical protein